MTIICTAAITTPEQWLDRPDILKKISNISKKPISIPFPWECFPEQCWSRKREDITFDWLEEVIDNLYKKNLYDTFHTIRSKTKMDGR